MAYSNDVRIAVLERDVRDLEASLKEVNGKLDSIVTTLAQVSGGKRALIGFFAIVGSVVTAAAALAGIAVSFIGRQSP